MHISWLWWSLFVWEVASDPFFFNIISMKVQQSVLSNKWIMDCDLWSPLWYQINMLFCNSSLPLFLHPGPRSPSINPFPYTPFLLLSPTAPLFLAGVPMVLWSWGQGLGLLCVNKASWKDSQGLQKIEELLQISRVHRHTLSNSECAWNTHTKPQGWLPATR